MDSTEGRPQQEHISDPSVRHETTDVSARFVFWGLLSVAVLLVLVSLVLWGVYRYFAAGQARLDPSLHPLAAERAPRPPEPRLQPNPAVDLQQLRRAEQQRLNSYSWVDRERGVVRIPIERAIEIVAERGLPARQAQGRQYASPPQR